MSTDVARTREVIIHKMADGEQDEYGNVSPVETAQVPERAKRTQTATDENITNVDRAKRIFTYVFRAKADISGRDRIWDVADGKWLKIIGEPDYPANSIGVVHHCEVVAELLEG